jgi:hypothetical protein
MEEKEFEFTPIDQLSDADELENDGVAEVIVTSDSPDRTEMIVSSDGADCIESTNYVQVVGEENPADLKIEGADNLKFSTNEALGVDPQVVEEAKPKNQATEHAEFMANDKNQKGAYEMAQQILAVMGPNWFGWDSAIRKINSGIQNYEERKVLTVKQMHILGSFGLAETKTGEWKDGRGKGELLREQVWKITITPQARMEALIDIINWHQEKVRGLMSEYEALRAGTKS